LSNSFQAGWLSVARDRNVPAIPVPIFIPAGGPVIGWRGSLLPEPDAKADGRRGGSGAILLQK